MQPRSWRGVLWAWVLTRTFSLVLAYLDGMTAGDVRYYYDEARAHSLTTALLEYPFPSALALSFPAKTLPWLVYDIGFATLAVVIDGLIALAFYRHFGGRAAWRWTWLVACLGPIAYYRFDIYVAASLAVFVLAVPNRPWLSGLAVASGFGVKLWPAIFGIGMAGSKRQRWQHMFFSLLGGLTLLVGTAVSAGVDRIFSPLKWQGSRGFHTEAVLSSVIGLRQLFGDGLPIRQQNGAWEYVGENLAHWTWIPQLLGKLGYVAVLALLAVTCYLLRNSRGSRDEANPDEDRAALTSDQRHVLGVGLTAVIGMFVVTSPVISPQYMIWMIPGLVLVPAGRMRRLGYALMIGCQLNLPWLFDGVVSHDYLFASAYRVAIFCRNVVLMWLVIESVRWLLTRVQATRRTAANS